MACTRTLLKKIGYGGGVKLRIEVYQGASEAAKQHRLRSTADLGRPALLAYRTLHALQLLLILGNGSCNREVPDGTKPLMGNLFGDYSLNCNFASRGSPQRRLAPPRLSGSQSPFFLLVLVFTFPPCCQTAALLLDEAARRASWRMLPTHPICGHSEIESRAACLLPPPGGTPHSLCGGTVPTTPAAAAACYLCLLHHRSISKSKAISSLFPDCSPKKSLTQAPPATSKFPTTQTHPTH
ncbi:hypothetical protein BGX38DRAFT_205602 [Terfezia claveryi]|nr:hypothetical protein BGX38DRAFT_205602 [Terfezia claveryi]